MQDPRDYFLEKDPVLETCVSDILSLIILRLFIDFGGDPLVDFLKAVSNILRSTCTRKQVNKLKAVT